MDFIPFEKSEVEQSIGARFASQVRHHGDELSVNTPSEALTYDELDQTSTRLAGAILAMRGVTPQPIGVVLDAGAEFVVALLAVLKAGHICVPIDPAAPVQRICTLVEEAGVRLVLTDGTIRGRISGAVQPLATCLDIATSTVFPAAAGVPPPGLSPDSLACIVFTSGSTGPPKGVLHSHRTLLHQAMVQTNELRIVAKDRFAFVGSPGAIHPLWVVLAALLNGASVFPLDARRQPAQQLLEWMAQKQVTVLLGGISVFRGATSEDSLALHSICASLRLVSFGGEPIYRSDVELARRLFPRALVSVTLGATETGTVTRYIVDDNESIVGHVVPIGYPSEDQQVLLMDENGCEVGIDAPGEIVVRSQYLSLGYWRRPELTAAAFQSDPAGGPARLYRTGDVARRRPDGCLFHLGRKDFQVKIRGFRVEVAAVEGALLSLPNVKEVTVMAREDRPGERRLVAYLVPTSRPAPTVSLLRKALADALPDYMVPATYIVLDALPKTSGGKVDRRALPAPGRTRPDLDQPMVAPRTPVEATLCAIWREVLDLDEVGVHDAFLDLGGNSLAAARIMTRIAETFRVDLPLRAVFEAPTINGLAPAVVECLVQCLGSDAIARLLPTPPGRNA